MKAQEINLQKEGFNLIGIKNDRSHYKTMMNIGRIFPTTKSQAKYFIKEGICLGELNADDVDIIESLLNKHGYTGNYKYTKSKSWVRLLNHNDLHSALKSEYNV